MSDLALYELSILDSAVVFATIRLLSPGRDLYLGARYVHFTRPYPVCAQVNES